VVIFVDESLDVRGHRLPGLANRAAAATSSAANADP
jgi:hypothetical protein